MRIGVLTSSYPRFDGDAAGSFVAAHVATMRAQGHEVDIIAANALAARSAERESTTAPRGAATGRATSLFDRGGAPDALERGGIATYLGAARITASMTLEATRRAHSWDLVVAHWLVPSALAAVPSALAAVPSVLAGRPTWVAASGTTTARRRATPSRPAFLAIVHGGDLHTLRRLHLLALALYTLRACNAKLAFVSAELRDVARHAAPGLEAYLDSALVQPMGIDVARFTAIRTHRLANRKRPEAHGDRARSGAHLDRDGETSATFKIVVVARLVPVKGVDVALAAYRLLKTRAELVVAGDGPERARLESLATTATSPSASTSMSTIASPSPSTSTSTNTSTGVTFLGAVDAATRDRLLRDADLVVIPSRVLPNGRSEGAPMIALEALASGVRVIASAVGGLRDLASRFAELELVPPDDPHALGAAIDRALAARSAGADVRGGIQADLTADIRDDLFADLGGDRADDAAALATFDWPHVATRLFQHAGIATGCQDSPPLCEAGDTSQRRGA